MEPCNFAGSRNLTTPQNSTNFGIALIHSERVRTGHNHRRLSLPGHPSPTSLVFDAETRSSGIDVAPLARAEKKAAEYQEPG